MDQRSRSRSQCVVVGSTSLYADIATGTIWDIKDASDEASRRISDFDMLLRYIAASSRSLCYSRKDARLHVGRSSDVCVWC